MAQRSRGSSGRRSARFSQEFIDGVREYYSTQAARRVTPDNLVEHLEALLGVYRELDMWLRQRGYPPIDYPNGNVPFTFWAAVDARYASKAVRVFVLDAAHALSSIRSFVEDVLPRIKDFESDAPTRELFEAVCDVANCYLPAVSRPAEMLYALKLRFKTELGHTRAGESASAQLYADRRRRESAAFLAEYQRNRALTKTALARLVVDRLYPKAPASERDCHVRRIRQLPLAAGSE